MAKRRLEVVIAGDASSLNRAFGTADKAARGFGGVLGGVGKIAAGVFGGALLTSGVRALTSGFGSMIEEAREAARVGRLTDAVLKSTGSSSWISAGQVGALAEKTSQLIGVDDDLIQANANVLLTFTKVRNEVGKGNDVFDQAVGLANDMAVALGVDAKGASIQLGKALNDPIRGITALRRSGVSFTKAQEKQIKALVDSGDLLGAQKVILKELAKEFGGAAKAAADPAQKLKVTWDNLKERVGTAVLPILNRAAEWLGEKLPKAFEELRRRAEPVVRWIRDRVIAAFEDVSEWARKNWPKIRDAILDAFERVEEWVRQNWPKIRKIIETAATGIVEAFTGVIGIVMGLWAIFRDVFLPIIEDVASAALTVLVPAFQGIVDVVNDRIIPAIDALIGWFKDNETAAKAIATVISTVLIVKYVALAVEAGKAAVKVVAAWATMLWTSVAQSAIMVNNLVVMGVQWATTARDARRAAEGMRASWFIAAAPAGATIGVIAAAVALLILNWDKAVAHAVESWRAIKDNLAGIWNFMYTNAKFVWDNIYDVLSGIWRRIKDAYDNTIGKLPGIGGGLPGLPGIGDFDIPGVPFFHQGGVFQAPNGQREGLAMLESGERVLSRAETARGGGTTINLTVNAGMGANGVQIGREIVEQIVKYQRVNGPVPIKVA